MKKSLKFFISSVLFIMIIGGIVYASHPFKIHHRRIIPQNISIVSLGDSLTQGIGDQTKRDGYVPMLANKLSNHGLTHVTTYNYGIAGEKSNQINHRLMTQPNIQKHLRRANLIVLTVGGNDLLQTLEGNMFDSKTFFNRNLNVEQNAYQHNLIKLLTHVRQYNHHAHIYVFGIYNPFYVYFPNVTSVTNSVNKWNRTTQTSLKQFKHINFVDINNLSYGQYQSLNSRKALTDNISNNNNNLFRLLQLVHKGSGELNHYLSPVDHFHPNDKGYMYMTNQLYHSIKINQYWY